jgi:fructokinase
VDRVPEVVCAGEVLFDCFPDGTRIPGGAPANVAFHAAALGCRARLVSAVGADPDGAALRAWLSAAGVGTSDLEETGLAPTGRVDVRESSAGPAYEIGTPAAWDFLRAAATPHGRPGTFVFGTLAQRHPVSRAAIRAMATRARDAGWLTLADLNLRAPFFDEETILWTLRHADVLKLNADELGTVSGLLGAAGDTEALFTGLLREFSIARGVLTLGAAGAMVCEDGHPVRIPARPVAVADTVGAGDAFCAVLAASLACGLSPVAALPWCTEAAAFVASRTGATPPWPRELSARLRRGLQIEPGHGLD